METKLAVRKRRLGEDTVETYRKLENFQDKILNDNFMRNHLKQIQNNICPVCNKPFEKTDIIQMHHIEYDNTCCYVENPRCETCYDKNPEMFAKCRKLLILTHKYCHLNTLHKEYRNDKERHKKDEDV